MDASILERAVSRYIFAYAIIILLIACVAVVVVLSRRFNRYEEALRRGNHDAKRVWKPFWIP